jgi:hypothetical protein
MPLAPAALPAAGFPNWACSLQAATAIHGFKLATLLNRYNTQGTRGYNTQGTRGYNTQGTRGCNCRVS